MKTAAKNILRRLGFFEPVQRLVWKTRIQRSARKIDLSKVTAPGPRGARCVRFDSGDQFRKERAQNAGLWNARRILERELCSSPGGVLLKGTDPLTGKVESFYHAPFDKSSSAELNVRESLACRRLGFSCRIRSTLVSLRSLISETELKTKVVYLTEQTTVLFKFFKVCYPTVIGSEYLGAGKTPGTIVNGIRHEDITGLSFENASVDVLITLEVLEHVPHYRTALTEIVRVLRPGGLALITVPFSPWEEANLERARLEPNGQITHLLPPEYHGDPVNLEAGILSFRQYGWGFLQELREAGFREVFLLENWDLDSAMLGDGLLVICALK